MYPAMPPPPNSAFSRRSARSRSRPPRWVVVSGLVWLSGLASWLLAGTVFLAVSSPGDPGRVAIVVIAILAAVAVLATLAWGCLVGRRRATVWLSPAVAAGTAVQLFTYVTAMLAAPQGPGDANNDNAGGAGLAILAVPTAMLILALLWLGAGIGALSRIFIKSRPSSAN
jgi:hypothetical protein